MQKAIKDKNFSVLMGIITALGIMSYIVISHDIVFYVMITAIWSGALIYDRDRKKHIWHYTASYLLLMLFFYLLLSF
ncbi:hypothetical protein [Jeotgalibacillus terrae]|uniref:Uncharacterized protein n=1 Tax=Jeotgalibacillus terrae TaxID=587735 RepID=A0ABW5ZNG4_9BACL|nr:hypothetical protein [Jeotgalibacillus terrae]MBM7578159.1 hypothetical protein [Jeotgalibacillus terrae]